MAQDSGTLSLEAAIALLRQFLCVDRLPPEQIPANSLVQQALHQVREHSDYQIFGICADSTTVAIAALHSYLAALDYAERPTTEAIAGPVYLKFNPQTGRCHLDTYTGDHRGVLVSCQSADDGDVQETFGHLPLDLFTVS